MLVVLPSPLILAHEFIWNKKPCPVNYICLLIKPANKKSVGKSQVLNGFRPD
jgi:hypothetical protein